MVQRKMKMLNNVENHSNPQAGNKELKLGEMFHIISHHIRSFLQPILETKNTLFFVSLTQHGADGANKQHTVRTLDSDYAVTGSNRFKSKKTTQLTLSHTMCNRYNICTI